VRFNRDTQVRFITGFYWLSALTSQALMVPVMVLVPNRTHETI
jgi:hypothetical protein